MVHLVLTAFESSFQLTTAATLPDYEPAIGDVSAIIDLDVKVTKQAIRETFFYRTDDPITSDASFVYYYVDKAKWADFINEMDPYQGTIKEGTNLFGTNVTDNVGKDFLRELARQLFGTYIGADLFTNEDAVNTHIETKCGEVATTLLGKMTDVDIANTSLQGPDAAGAYFKKDDTSDTNLCRALLNQLLDIDGADAGATTRFADTTADAYTAKGTGYFHIPFMENDTISYKLTLSPAADQHTVVGTDTGRTMTPRTYRVRMTVGA